MITLEAKGIPYSNFISANVFTSVQTLSSTFDFLATMSKANDFPIKLQDSIRVLIDGKAVLTGIVEVLEPFYSVDSSGSAEEGIKVQGRSITSDVVMSSLVGPLVMAPGFGSISLKSVVEKILGINGLPIKVIDISGSDPFSEGELLSQSGLSSLQSGLSSFSAGDKIVAKVGENLFDVINKYCEKRQALATTDGDGNIVLTRGGSGSLKAKLTSRRNTFTGGLQGVISTAAGQPNTRENNILSARARYSDEDRFNRYIVRTQQNLSAMNEVLAKINNESVVDQSGEAFDRGIRTSRATVLPSDSSNSNQTAKQRAIWEANIKRSRGFNFSCSVQGFVAEQDTGRIWAPNNLVQVQDDFSDINSTLLIKDVRYIFSLNNGSITEMNLSYNDSFTLNAQQGPVSQRTNKFGANFEGIPQ